MSRFFLTLWVGVLFGLGGSAVLTAQNGSYDGNALRLEAHNGDVRIIRGVQGTVLGRIGTFRGLDVARLVSSSEKATVEAEKFARDYGPGSWIAAAGLATLGAAVGASQIDGVNRGIALGLTLASTGLIVYGGGRLQSAYNALSRSVWWYNRDLEK